VGNQLFHRRYQDHSKCPLCSFPNEKVSHVLRCPDLGARALATDIFEGRFRTLLQSLDIFPPLIDTFCSLLRSWRLCQSIYPIHFSLALRPALYAQSTIGWTNFFLGRWTPVWRTLQNAHYVSIASKRTSLRWTTAVIHQLLLTAWDLWQYRNNRLHGEAGRIWLLPSMLFWMLKFLKILPSALLVCFQTLPTTSPFPWLLSNSTPLFKSVSRWIRSVSAGNTLLKPKFPPLHLPKNERLCSLGATRSLPWLLPNLLLARPRLENDPTQFHY